MGNKEYATISPALCNLYSDMKKIRAGASMKYFRTKRGEGVQISADFADKQYCGHADKGGRGSKNPKILRTCLMEAPSAARVDNGLIH